MRILVVALGLVCSMLAIVAPTASAESQRRLTMDAPSPAGRGHVVLKGRSDRKGHVVLQRSADGRWVKVRRVPVRRGGYQVTVPTRPKEQRFRVRAGAVTSQVRVVGASRPTDTQDACGKRPVKADGSRWSCTFVDDFDGDRLDRSRWVVHDTHTSGPANGNYACYRNHRDNVAVARGTLRLTVRQHDRAIACGDPRRKPSRFTAGQVSTYHKFSQRYGLFEARFKVAATRAPGLQEAFWMWPDDRQDIPVQWPAAGEIDVVETYSDNPELAIPFLHYTWYDNGGPKPGTNTAWNCKALRGVFNTYTLEWSAERLEIFVNGDSCLVNTSGDSAFQRKYILALTQALGVGRNAHVGDAPLPATMAVDYVRVWK